MKPNPCGCQVNTITYAIRYCPMHAAAKDMVEILLSAQATLACIENGIEPNRELVDQVYGQIVHVLGKAGIK